MVTFDLDRAMCVYLGGRPDGRAINLSKRDERLNAEFGADAGAVKLELDRVLDTFAKPALRRGIPDGHTLASWIARDLPALSKVCRQKIEMYVEYYMSR